MVRPRPHMIIQVHPSFSMLHAKKPPAFQRATLKSWDGPGDKASLVPIPLLASYLEGAWYKARWHGH